MESSDQPNPPPMQTIQGVYPALRVAGHDTYLCEIAEFGKFREYRIVPQGPGLPMVRMVDYRDRPREVKLMLEGRCMIRCGSSKTQTPRSYFLETLHHRIQTEPQDAERLRDLCFQLIQRFVPVPCHLDLDALDWDSLMPQTLLWPIVSPALDLTAEIKALVESLQGTDGIQIRRK